MRLTYELVTALWLALDSIRAHKLRSFLTLLGIIIGVASVILVGAAIDGLGAYAEGVTAKALGTNSFVVAQVASVGRLSAREYADKLRQNKRIRMDDIAFLRSAMSDSILYSAYTQRAEDVKAGDQTYEGAAILGASYTLPDIRDIVVVEGRFFTESEERAGQRVAVIGEEIRSELFAGTSPLGRTLSIRGVPFTVVGLLERQGSSFGRSLDNPVYIPIGMYHRLFGGANRGMAVFGKARDDKELSVEEALDNTRAALRSKFHTPPGKPDAFDTLTADSARSFTSQILGVIAAIVVPVTAISLVVGGIVVMNIMLVSVTERTREIGVRKSLGARQSDIMLQILTESVILSLFGGLLGVAVGYVVSAALAAAFDLTLRVTFPYVFLSIFVSSAVGIVAGWYPARRAARLDPVVALRAE